MPVPQRDELGAAGLDRGDLIAVGTLADLGLDELS
jgi:hypothetical protein